MNVLRRIERVVIVLGPSCAIVKGNGAGLERLRDRFGTGPGPVRDKSGMGPGRVRDRSE